MDSPLIDTIATSLDVDRGRIAVIASRAGRVIARVTHPSGAVVAKVSTEAGAFDAEAAAMGTLAALGIPVSEVRTVKPGPPALLVATWANGEPITAASSPAALRSVGRILRRIHRVPAGPPFSANPTVASWIQGWYAAVFAWWEAVERIDPGLRRAADDWMMRVRPVIETRPGCLFLLDGRPEHFLVDADDAIRMIDVADLQPGDGAMDLAVLELDAPGILPHVLEGYAPSIADQAAFEVLIPFYVFLRALSAAEWRQRMLGDEAGSRPLLDIARTALAMSGERSEA